MSAETRTTVVQTQIIPPKLSDLNPANSEEPLISALKHGEIPSNETFNDAIDRARNTLNEVKGEVNLDIRGEKILKDTTEILDSFQKVINERNKDDKIQDLIQHSKEASEELGKVLPKTVRDVNRAVKDTTKDISKELHLPSIKPLIPLATLSFSGPLATLGSLATLSNVISQTGFKFPDSDIKGETLEIYNYGKELFSYAIRSKEFRGFVEEIIDFFHESCDEGYDKLHALSDGIVADFKEGDKSLPSTSKAVKEIASDAKEIIKEKEEWTEDKAKEYYQKFSALITKLSEKDEYKKILELFWNWMDHMIELGYKAKDFLQEKAEGVATEVKDKAVEKVEKIEHKTEKNVNRLKKSLDQSMEQAGPAVDKLWNDIRDIVDGFCGVGSFNHLYNRIWKLFSCIFDDKEAQAYFRDLKSFVNRAVGTPLSLKNTEMITEGKEIFKRGREVYQSQKYSRRFNKVVSQAKRMIHKIKTDPLTNDLTAKLNQLGHDLFLDEKGRPDIFIIQDSLSQLKTIAFPIISKQLAHLTIDRVVGQTDQYDYELENVVVSLPDVMPESFDIRTKNHVKVDVNGLNTNVRKNITNIILDIEHIKPTFRNVKFWYKRKIFPTMEDRGVADVDLSSGEGVKIRIIWKVKSVENTPFAFSLMRVKCIIQHLSINIKDAKHDILDNLALPFVTNKIKQAVAQGIVDAIVLQLQPLNDTMNKWFATRPMESMREKAYDSIHDSMEKANVFIQSHPLEKSLEIVSDALDNVKGLASSKLEHVVDSTKDKFGEIKDRSAQIKDRVMDKSEDIKKLAGDVIGADGIKTENVKEKLSDLKDKATDLYEQLKDKLPDKTSDLLNIGSDKYEQFKEILPERAHELVKMGSEKFETLKGKLPKEYSAKLDDYYGKATELLAEWRKNLPEKVSDKVSELKDKIPAADEMKKIGMEKLGELQEMLPKNTDELKEKAVDLKDKATEKMKEISENIPTGPTDLVHKVEDKIKDMAYDKLKDMSKEKIKEFASEKYNELKDNLPANKEELKQQASDLKDKATDKASDLYEQLKGKLPESTQEILNVGAEKFAEYKDVLPEKAHELVQMGSDKFQELKGKLPKEYSDKLDDYYSKASDIVKNIKEKAPEKMEDLKEKATELKDKVTEKATDKVKEVRESLPEGAVDLKDLAVDAKDKATDKATGLKEKATDAKDKAVDKASDLYEQLKGKFPENTQELLNLGNDKYQELKEVLPEKAHELIEMGSEKFQQLKSKLPKEYSEKLDDYYSKASEIVKNIKNKAPETVEDLKSKLAYVPEDINQLKDKVVDKASDVKDQVTDKVKETKDKVVEKASDVKDQVQDKAQEQIEKVDTSRLVEQGVSYSAALKSDANSTSNSNASIGKSNSGKSKNDWHFQWQKPKKTFNQAKVTKESAVKDMKEENPYDALMSKQFVSK